MRKLLFLSLLGLAVVIFSSCSREEMVYAPEDSSFNPPGNSVQNQLIAGQIIQTSGWKYYPDEELPAVLGLLDDKMGPQYLRDYERETVVGDIAHYWWDIPVGPGEYEKVRLHRVVKERGPNRPIHTKKTLFAVHGTPGNFEVMFLVGTVVPDVPEDHSMAAYLAQNDVDVWGIDQAYTLLEGEITDFSFMQDWGIQFDAENILTGMSIARFVRSFTGSGHGKMNLLGYSTGFMTGFAALNMETQLPPGQRQIGGFIPVDYFYKTQDPIWIENECAYASDVLGLIQSGVYQVDFGLLFQTLGYLAENDPDGDSPVIPGVTNRLAALMAGAQTNLVFGFPGDVHFFGGIYDIEGNLVDLNYTPTNWYLGWLQGFNDYNSNFVEYDIAALHCDEIDSPFDDHLHEITVPVFFLGARGGFGHLMDYTATLIGSDDISILNIQLDPEVMLDIGHVDLATAVDAPGVCWEPVLNWVISHQKEGSNSHKEVHLD